MFMVDFLIYKTRITAGSKQEQVRWIKNDHKKKKLKWLDAVCFIQRGYGRRRTGQRLRELGNNLL